MVQLPISQEGPHFRFSTELDDTTFGFEFRWNARDSAWYMSIFDGNGTELASGIKVVLNAALPANYTAAGMPGKALVAVDTAGTDEEAGYSDLGRRIIIVYDPSDEAG